MGVGLSEDVEVLLLEPSPAFAPPAPWSPTALPAFDWRPSVLLVGRDLSPRDRALVERAGVLERVSTLAQGLARMGEARWEVVVVSPSFADETDGLRFVRAFKGSSGLIGASQQLRQLRERYRRTPFVVQPLAGDTQFAVCNAAARWFLGSTTTAPLAEAILRCAASP